MQFAIVPPSPARQTLEMASLVPCYAEFGKQRRPWNSAITTTNLKTPSRRHGVPLAVNYVRDTHVPLRHAGGWFWKARAFCGSIANDAIQTNASHNNSVLGCHFAFFLFPPATSGRLPGQQRKRDMKRQNRLSSALQKEGRDDGGYPRYRPIKRIHRNPPQVVRTPGPLLLHLWARPKGTQSMMDSEGSNPISLSTLDQSTPPFLTPSAPAPGS